jgi:hypothetical protein
MSVSRFTRREELSLIGAGTPILDQSWFEPHQRYTMSFVAHVPSNLKLDLLRLRVDMVVAKGDRLFLGDKLAGPSEQSLEGGGRGIITEWAIQDRSLVHRLTSDSRRLVTEVILDNPGSPRTAHPQLGVYIYRTSAGWDPGYDTRMQRVYFIANNFSFAELPLSATP